MPDVIECEELDELDIELALDLAFQGCGRGYIAAKVGLSIKQFWRLRQRNPTFASGLHIAWEEGAHVRGEAMRETAKYEPDVMRARLMNDTEKFLLERLFPKHYANRSLVDVHHTVDLIGAMKEAKGRVRPTDVQQLPAASQPTDIIDIPRQTTTGHKPVAEREIVVIGSKAAKRARGMKTPPTAQAKAEKHKIKRAFAHALGQTPQNEPAALDDDMFS